MSSVEAPRNDSEAGNLPGTADPAAASLGARAGWVLHGRAERLAEAEPVPPVRTKLYLWGQAPPANPALCRRGAASWEARCVAVRSGWEESSDGAWAVELVLPFDLAGALDALESMIRGETASVGWRLRPLRDD